MSDFTDLDPIYFVLIGLFISVLLTSEGIRQWFSIGRDTEKVKTQRLRMLAKGQSTAEILGQLRQPINVSKWQNVPIFGNIPAKMRQAGMQMKPSVFIAACLGVTLFLFLVTLSQAGFLPAFLIAFITGMFVPLNVINIMRKKRVEAFAAQLPDALDLMKRGLSVGHPLNVTISNVAANMSDPIGTEFGLMADQIAYGEDLPDAFSDLAMRMDQEDMHYLSASVAIQYGSGGNLGAMLGTLANVIRKRFAMRRRIRAISSEGRISALLLSGLPFLMYGATTITAPGYYTSVSGDPMFKWMAGAVVIFVVGNAVMLRKLVNFRF